MSIVALLSQSRGEHDVPSATRVEIQWNEIATAQCETDEDRNKDSTHGSSESLAASNRGFMTFLRYSSLITVSSQADR